MFKFFKPYLGPTALICLEKGMNAAGFPLTDFWAGARGNQWVTALTTSEMWVDLEEESCLRCVSRRRYD